MTDTLTTSIAPSASGTSGSIAPRMISSRLGDGYRHDVADGINPTDRSYQLVWEAMPEAEAEALVAFLASHVGEPFLYRLPREQRFRAFVWVQLNVSHPLPGHDTVSVTLEERFSY